MSKRRGPTFAELVAAERDRPRPRPDVRPGAFDLHGRLFDPQGRPVERVEVDVDPACAAELVAAGAQVALECCGCGGGGGCQPEWFTASDAEGVPVFERRASEPTWIDVWEGPDDVRLVFLHGAVSWPGVLDV